MIAKLNVRLPVHPVLNALVVAHREHESFGVGSHAADVVVVLDACFVTDDSSVFEHGKALQIFILIAFVEPVAGFGSPAEPRFLAAMPCVVIFPTVDYQLRPADTGLGQQDRVEQLQVAKLYAPHVIGAKDTDNLQRCRLRLARRALARLALDDDHLP